MIFGSSFISHSVSLRFQPRLWIEAAFDGEVPQPLYGVGISGEARGTSPAATPVNASGVGVVFFCWKNLEEKNEFFFWKVL